MGLTDRGKAYYNAVCQAKKTVEREEYFQRAPYREL